MCSVEKSKKPSRMPTFDWMITDSRSAGVKVDRVAEPPLAAVPLAAVDVGVVEDS